MSSNPQTYIRKTTGAPVVLGIPVGGGGEGSVYKVKGCKDLAVKLYHNVDAERSSMLATKLGMMIARQPARPPPTDHCALAWPTELVADATTGLIAGFCMPFVDEIEPLFQYFIPDQRISFHPGFNYKYLVRAASNLASVVESVHKVGYVIGDLNESNVNANGKALITIVDVDSFQVSFQAPGPAGNPRPVFYCSVGKPEYMAPELFDKDLESYERQPAEDRFSLGVLLFQLLMEGWHPFQGTGDGPPELGERVRQRVLPGPGEAPPARPPVDILPPVLREMFDLCFRAKDTDTGQRPHAKTWRKRLQAAERTLTSCNAKPNSHFYFGHLKSCPWCQRQTETGYDSFEEVSPMISGRSAMAVNDGPSTPGASTPLGGAHPGALGPSPRSAGRRWVRAIVLLVLVVSVLVAAFLQYGWRHHDRGLEAGGAKRVISREVPPAAGVASGGKSLTAPAGGRKEQLGTEFAAPSSHPAEVRASSGNSSRRFQDHTQPPARLPEPRSSEIAQPVSTPPTSSPPQGINHDFIRVNPYPP
jgi:hypothetical protein